MSDEAAITGAAVPLKIGDKEFMMSPLTDRDIVELDLWVQAKYVQIARESARDENLQERNRIEELATKTAASLTWMHGTGAQILASVDGMARLVWQAVRKNHPSVSLSELRALMFSEENIKAAQEAFAKANKVPRQSVKKGASRKRSQKQKSTGFSLKSMDLRPHK